MKRLGVGVAAGAAMWTAPGLLRKRNNPSWESDIAAWQERWTEKGLPGTPGPFTTFGIVAAFGGVHAAGYVSMLRLLPRGAVRSGAAYGVATNVSFWALTWAASRYLGETKRPTWSDARNAIRSATYGGALGWIVARA